MNFFLIPLDAQRKWYRYHHIFSEVVRRQVASLDPDLITATLRKAALWLARNNYLEDAMRSAFQSNDIEFTADLIEDYITDYIVKLDLAAGLRWILKLPENVLDQRALLRLYQCCFLSILMELSHVKKIISTIEKNRKPDFGGYSGRKLTLCQEYTAYFKCVLHILNTGETEVVAQFQAIRDKISPQNPLLVGAIESQVVLMLVSNGNLDTAEALLNTLSAVTVTTSDDLIKKKIIFAKIRALIARHRGRLYLAEEIICQFLQFINQKECGNSPMAFLLHRDLGSIFYLQNRLEKAQECAAIAAKYCEYAGLFDEIMAGNELWLQLHRAAGDYQQADQCIQQMHLYSIKLGIPRISASANVCAARIAIDQGNLANAVLWSSRRNLQPDEPFSLLFAMECLTQAQLFYDRKKFDKADHLLETLRYRCVKRSLLELVLQIDILQSAVLYAMDQQQRAILILKKALTFAETEGYIRPFVNYKESVAPVLKCIADEQLCLDSAAYLEKIFSVCGLSFERPNLMINFHMNTYDDLSPREIEVLELMAQGLKNKEIAQKAFISINTVKRHVHNILEKLNVETRTRAVLIAMKMKALKKR